MLRNEKIDVCVVKGNVVKTSEGQEPVSRAYSTPSLLVIGQAAELIQGGIRGGWWDGANGRRFTRP
jgi:hypothetical protein